MSNSSLPARASSLLESITARRTYYALGNKAAAIADSTLVELVTEVVKQSPSAFNSQTSRVLILQGQDHKHYWEEIITRGVKDAFPPEAFAKQQGRLAAFAGARGTIVILEDLQAVEDLGKANPFVDKFTHSWSQQSSGMLQINLWNLLTQLGYGANLQHFAPVLGAEDSVREKWLKSEQLQDVNKWKINAELVFGSREGEPKEKGFTDKHRVLAFGQE